MPRKVVRKERGVFEKVPGSDTWWIRFKDAGVEHREKVGRRGDAIKLYKIRKADILRGVKMPANMKDKGIKFSVLAQEAIDWYVNRHDWDGVRELIRADAQLLVADQFQGEFRQSPYFRNYEGWMAPWRLAVGEVDNEIVAIVLQRDGERWLPLSAIRLEVIGEKVGGAVDYVHCPWVLANARSILIAEESGFEVEPQHDAANFPYPN
jgi:hypothetical protein